MSINLKIPDIRELKPRISVFGVGGAGGNAVNNMISAGLQGVDFVVANTDAQALTTSRADYDPDKAIQTYAGVGNEGCFEIVIRSGVRNNELQAQRPRRRTVRVLVLAAVESASSCQLFFE
jgi:hypothetical protein